MEELFAKVKEEYGIEIRDENDMTNAWRLVEALKERGWVVYIITAKGREQVDAWHPDYGTIFSQFGESPNFESTLEGILTIAVLARELEKNGTL